MDNEMDNEITQENDNLSDDQLWKESLEANGVNPEDTKEEYISVEEVVEVVEEEVEEVEEVLNEESPFYKNKSRDDLIQSLEHGTQKISRQENELNGIRKQLELIQQNQLLLSNQQKADPGDVDEAEEFLSQFDDDQMRAIDLIIEKKIKNDHEKELKNTSEQKDRNQKENNLAWKGLENTLNYISPGLKRKAEDLLLKEMESLGEDQTIYKSEWLQSFIEKRLPTLSLNDESNLKPNNSNGYNKDSLIKKKVNASTISSGSYNAGETSLKGKPEPRDPDEYLQWLNQNSGLKI